jgi:hypothetical protein
MPDVATRSLLEVRRAVAHQLTFFLTLADITINPKRLLVVMRRD